LAAIFYSVVSILHKALLALPSIPRHYLPRKDRLMCESCIENYQSGKGEDEQWIIHNVTAGRFSAVTRHSMAV